jgi:CRISPR-associated protein Cmr4
MSKPINTLYFLNCITSLHTGCGQGIGALDQPIAREVSTNIPVIYDSSVKGVLRDYFETCYKYSKEGKRELVDQLFGKSDEAGKSNVGALSISNALLLLLPVRSLKGIFAYVTSPYVLNRFITYGSQFDLFPEKATVSNNKIIPDLSDESRCVIPKNSQINLINNEYILLEDIKVSPQENAAIDEKIFNTLKESYALSDLSNLCIVHDNVFSYFLENATEVRARIRINDDTKTAEDGALWYEENLPPQSKLFGFLSLKSQNDEHCKHIGELNEQVLQFGGGGSLGRGLCNVYIKIPVINEE